ncbi:hypothetical protein OEZ86_002403 [Tetradesmus obliquus]|nr:hypothetical protein OEZ86_002403 [Tetradesmus obliquus]
MDGTLTVPVIDFQYMRQRVGVGPTGDILDIISSWPAEEQQRAHQAILEIEEQALRDMQAMPGLLELCSHLDDSGIPRGLITRNVLRSVHYFHEHHLPVPPFLPAISRECEFPYKPSPAALLHICNTWGIAPEECIMVGDSAKDDVVCGNRAGAVTVLLDTEGRTTLSMETVRARDQGPVAAEGRNPIKAAMRAVGIGAGAPAGEHDDTVVRDADAAHHEALAREAEVDPAVEGKEQLLQEREWDRHGSKQGRRDLPAEVVEKHPSLASADTTLPTPPTTTTATTTAGSDSAACATCGISRNITSSTTANACPACGPRGNTSAANIDTYIDGSSSSSSAITGLQHNHPLMGLSDECGLCAAAPGALEAEREALLGKAAELEQEGAAHAAAAAEAEAMRARAAARAAELEARLRTDFTSRRQTLLQQQEAASAELSRLNATRAGVVQRVHSLEGQLGRLVDEEAALLQQRAEGG